MSKSYKLVTPTHVDVSDRFRTLLKVWELFSYLFQDLGPTGLNDTALRIL